MKKCLITLACFCLSACYYALPASDYYYDDGYVEPGYYSQTTYVAPSTSHIYISEQPTYHSPDVVYIDNTPPRHHTPKPHHYYYPKHEPHHSPSTHAPKKEHRPENLKIHQRPQMGKNERVVREHKDSPNKGSHAPFEHNNAKPEASHSPEHHPGKHK